MYKSLEDGLRQCFPYGQDPMPNKIPAVKSTLFKHRVFVEKKEQVQLEQEELGTIWRKFELYCILLKKTLVLGGGPKKEGSGLIIQ